MLWGMGGGAWGGGPSTLLFKLVLEDSYAIWQNNIHFVQIVCSLRYIIICNLYVCKLFILGASVCFVGSIMHMLIPSFVTTLKNTVCLLYPLNDLLKNIQGLTSVFVQCLHIYFRFVAG